MDTAAQHVRQLAREAAADRQFKAAVFAALHAKNPLFRKTMRCGRQLVVVQMEWPGILRTYDAATGELLSEGVPGAPGQLSPGF
jgi:hypothetical protein